MGGKLTTDNKEDTLKLILGEKKTNKNKNNISIELPEKKNRPSNFS